MGARASTAVTSTETHNGTADSTIRSRAFSTSAGSPDSSLNFLQSGPSFGNESNNPFSHERVIDRGRTRSLSGIHLRNGSGALSFPSLFARATGSFNFDGDGSDTERSSPDEFLLDSPLDSFGINSLLPSSLPAHLWSLNGFKCPVCSKLILPDDLEYHLVLCFTKPQINYNEETLNEDKGECVICLEDMSQGDTIARLPCLCIYHKSCLDQWFQVNRSCPGHPD